MKQKNKPIGGKLIFKKGIRSGDSSSSNPSITFHRDAAKASRKFKGKNEPSIMAKIPEQVLVEPTEKLCVTPSGVFIGLSPQPPLLQKIINAALESSEDVLKERLPEDFTDSFCAYFAALLPLLQSTQDLVISHSQKRMDDESHMQILLQLTGILYPLSAVTRRVPSSVIQLHWSTLAKSVHNILPLAEVTALDKNFQDSDDEDEGYMLSETKDLNLHISVLLLRSLLSIISRLLIIRATSINPAVKSEPEDWRLPNGISANLFAALFHFNFHSKPRVRRVARAAIVRILSDANVVSNGIVAKQTAEMLTIATRKATETSETHEAALRRCLSLTHDVAPYINPSSLKVVAEMLLSLSILGSNTIRKLAYSALAACCANDSDCTGKESKSSVSLPESLAAALMSDFRPPTITAANIPQVLVSVYSEWLRCVQIAHMAVLRRNPIKAMIALPILFEAIFSVFIAATSSITNQGDNSLSNDRKKLATLAADLLQTWIGAMGQLIKQNQQEEVDFSHVSMAVDSLILVLENSLGFEHHEAWPQILNFIAHVINQLGETLPAVEGLVNRLLPALAELHFNASNRLASSPEVGVKTLLGAVDEVFGATITSFGPEIVVSCVPVLNFADEEICRLRKTEVDSSSWILLLLSRYADKSAHGCIARSRLDFFLKQLLPIHDRLAKAITAERSVHKGEIITAYLPLLYSRVWSTLPAFCVTCSENYPMIVPPEFARLLGEQLNNDASIRPFILNALRRLVENSPFQMMRYAKNFLPILFNLHINQAEEDLSAADDDGLVLQTIRGWMSESRAIDLQLAQHFMDRTWARLVEALAKIKIPDYKDTVDDSVETLPPLLLDLCSAILTRFSATYVRCFLIEKQRSVLVELLSASKMPSLQKRVYRLLEDTLELIANRSSQMLEGYLSPEDRFNFVQNDIQPLLVNAMTATSAPARRARLTCLFVFAKSALCSSIENRNNQFYSTLLWEAVASLVDVNTRARIAAVKLLMLISSTIVSPQAALAMCEAHDTVEVPDGSSDDDSATIRVESLIRMLLDRLPVESLWTVNQSQAVVDGCCAILIAIGRIYRHFKNPLIHEHVELLLDRVPTLLSKAHNSTFRRVSRCVLSTISCAISALPGSEIECMIPRLVPIVCGTTFPEVHRKPLRTTFERLLSRLAKKCGLEPVASALNNWRSQASFGEEKRLRHLFKTLNRTYVVMKTRSSEKAGASLKHEHNDDFSEEEKEETDYVKPAEQMSRVKATARTSSKHKGGAVKIIENVDEIADTSAPGSALRLAARQHGMVTEKFCVKSKPSKVGEIVMKKQRMVDAFDSADEATEEKYRNDDYQQSDGDSDPDDKRRSKTRKLPKTLKNQQQKRTVVGSGKSKNKVPKSSGKGRGLQPYSYRPLLRSSLNKRRSAHSK